tara:strand:+ start:5071 stop:6540 length:1470 start_codon:yes stop_codon:yes gene_type:complete
MKRAENFGAERMQCSSCGILTKRAETRLTEKQQEFINYVSMWPTERIENAWEVTQDLDQNGISMAIDISRSNVPRLVEPLITAGLVRKKKAHILDENNRVKSSKKLVYYLTPEGRKHVTESRRAETFEAKGLMTMGPMDFITATLFHEYGITQDVIDMAVEKIQEFGASEEQLQRAYDRAYRENIGPLYALRLIMSEENPGETFEATRSDLRRRRRTPVYKIERTDEDEDHDQNRYARNNAGGALWEATYQALRDEGRSHAQAEAFCNSKFFDHYYEYLIDGLRRPMRKVLKDIRRANRRAGSDFDKKYLIDEFIFDNQVFPDKASENFQAHEGGHIDDIFEAPKNAETTTFNATAYSMIEYQDDNCLEEIADSLRPKYGLEYNEGELFWDFDMQSGDVTLYIYDGDNKKLDEITYDREALAKALKEQGHKNPESWGAENMSPQVFGKLVGQYPVRPTRPSEDWPRPTPRPRRPNRRPNPRPRPARRPF